MENKEQNPPLQQPPVSCIAAFQVGDKVKKEGYRFNGTVWKISRLAVHVRFNDGMFERFYFEPYHHSQTSIEKLRHCN